MNTFTLNELEIKLINKLSLTKDDLFTPSRHQARKHTDANNKTVDLESITYINLKGFTGDNETLSFRIYPDRQDVSFFVSKDTGEVDQQTGKKLFDDRQVTSAEFKELLATRKKDMSESIDSI